MTIRILRHAKLYRPAAVAVFLLMLGVAATFTTGAAQQSGNDWPEFGSDVQSTSAPTFNTGITAANVASMTRHQVTLDGIVDASAI